jgi:hypothetical protein
MNNETLHLTRQSTIDSSAHVSTANTESELLGDNDDLYHDEKVPKSINLNVFLYFSVFLVVIVVVYFMYFL